MTPFSHFSVIALAVLHARKHESLSRYEVMSLANEQLQILTFPASPGAAYPALKKLHLAGMINYNHDRISITTTGSEMLRELLVSPPPLPLIEISIRMLAANVSNDNGLQKEWRKNIGLFLIRTDDDNPHDQKQESSLALWRSNIRRFVQRCDLDLSAIK